MIRFQAEIFQNMNFGTVTLLYNENTNIPLNGGGYFATTNGLREVKFTAREPINFSLAPLKDECLPLVVPIQELSSTGSEKF